ncbi:MAG: ABC transporter permease, partial [Acetobacteraceae bacterium]
MIGLVASRLAQIALTLAALSFVAFLLIGLMPGDPIALAIAGDPRLTAEDALRLRALHGLGTPILDRYAAWAASVLAGEVGHSRLFARPVASLLWPALGATLLLLGVAVLLAAGAGLLLGALAATRRRARGAVDALA